MKSSGGIIREYQSSDCEGVRRVYLERARRQERRRVIREFMQKSSSLRRTWQAGVVGLLGLQLSNYWLRQEDPTTSANNSAAAVFMMRMALWSAGVGLAWYIYMRERYWQRVREECDKFVEELASNKKMWVMEDEQGTIVGCIGLFVEEDEGRIRSWIGVESRIELALVRNLIQFARDNNVRVLATKCGDDAKWSDGPFCNI